MIVNNDEGKLPSNIHIKRLLEEVAFQFSLENYLRVKECEYPARNNLKRSLSCRPNNSNQTTLDRIKDAHS